MIKIKNLKRTEDPKQGRTQFFGEVHAFLLLGEEGTKHGNHGKDDQEGDGELDGTKERPKRIRFLARLRTGHIYKPDTIQDHDLWVTLGGNTDMSDLPMRILQGGPFSAGIGL